MRRTWEAAYVLRQYLSSRDAQAFEPSNPLLRASSGPRTIIELGSGTGYAGLALARAPVLLRSDVLVLTDLPEVCPLLGRNLMNARQQSRAPQMPAKGKIALPLQADVRVMSLPWGDLEAAHDAKRGLQGRHLTHIVASDLVYFPFLYAPLLRTLIALTSGAVAPIELVFAYKVRSLAREEPFWRAFGAYADARFRHATEARLQATGSRWSRSQLEDNRHAVTRRTRTTCTYLCVDAAPRAPCLSRQRMMTSS